MTVPELVLLAIAAYALAGIAFGLAFIAFGVSRIDPSARGTSWIFRVIILPGSAALWPLLAVRWARHHGDQS